jgi:hypothetical protein
MMLIGGCCWAYVIANICAIVVTVDYTSKNYMETMDQVCLQDTREYGLALLLNVLFLQVNDFLKKHGVQDFELSRNLRQYVIHHKEAYRDEVTRTLLDKLPPSLGGDCAKIASVTLLKTKVLTQKVNNNENSRPPIAAKLVPQNC